MLIEHINISAPYSLLKKTKNFYCEVFGLHVGYRPPFTRKGFWLYKKDVAVVHLTESDEHFACEKPYFLDHIAFKCSGVRLFKENLERLNIPYSIDHLEEIELTQVFFKDPAGIGLEANFKNEVLM